MTDPRESALAPLRAAADATFAVRAGAPEEARAAVLPVTNAAEASLRRLLRDDEAAPLALRLRALAPDELPPDALIAELRQRDRISIELAASFHDLLRIRNRFDARADLLPAERDLILRTVDRLEQEIRAAPRTSPPPAPLLDATIPTPIVADETLVHPVPPPDAPRSATPPWLWAALAAVLLLLVLLGVWWGAARRDGSGAMEQGITLFRSGAVAEAMPHFERYAEAHPDDPTPRLYLARIHRRAGRLERAGDELRQALSVAPNDPAVQRELGFLLLDSGRAEAAAQRFRSAVELDPESAHGWIGLVRALRASGQPGAAERVLARAPAEVRALVRQNPPQP